MQSLFFVQKLISRYRFINILSIDIVAGAIINALFFAEILKVRILPYGLIALGLTVWIIYTADHLRDAKMIGSTASSERHRFHQRNFTILFTLLIFAIALDAVVIFFMRRPVLIWGAILGFVVIMYLIIQHYLKILKEVFIACLYACGVLLPSITVTSQALGVNEILLFIQFGLVALINLLIFSRFDNENDYADNQHSFVTITGKRTATIFIGILSFINVVILMYLIWNSEYIIPACIYVFINVLLLAILIFSKKLQRQDNYRLLGDAVFLIPGIFLLWPH